MSWATALYAYFIIWWLTLFVVLPFGIERDETSAHGAPKDPKLRQKIVINSILSGLLWAILYILIEFDIVSFRELVRGY